MLTKLLFRQNSFNFTTSQVAILEQWFTHLRGNMPTMDQQLLICQQLGGGVSWVDVFIWFMVRIRMISYLQKHSLLKMISGIACYKIQSLDLCIVYFLR